MKKIEKIITAAQCRKSASIFVIGSMGSVLVPPLIMVWIAASMFIYASVAHHPDLRVRDYNRWAGYRFYGLVGTLVVILNFSNELKGWVGGGINLLLATWALGLLVVLPLGLLDLLRIKRENWKDLTVEMEVHE